MQHHEMVQQSMAQQDMVQREQHNTAQQMVEHDAFTASRDTKQAWGEHLMLVASQEELVAIYVSTVHVRQGGRFPTGCARGCCH